MKNIYFYKKNIKFYWYFFVFIKEIICNTIFYLKLYYGKKLTKNIFFTIFEKK